MALKGFDPRWTDLPDDIIGITKEIWEDPLLSPRAAVRWALTGRHDGWGLFGAPTGANLHVWGISHAEFGPWGLRRECVLFDEVQIWKPIHLQTGNL